jgi:hypothetical protein
MDIRKLLGTAVLLASLGAGAVAAQTSRGPEDFTAVAIANDNLGSGAGTIAISIDRWSTDADRNRLISTLREKGPRAMMRELQDMPAVGHIRTPDSLGHPLHFVYSTAGEDGGRRIVAITDRPIGFWETWENSRSAEYPFTVVQLSIDRHGRGSGTLSDATKILAYGDIIELENFSSAPIRLTEIESTRDE